MIGSAHPKSRIDILRYIVSNLSPTDHLRPSTQAVYTRNLYIKLVLTVSLAAAGNPIRFTILPLIVKALEIVLADLKGGRG